MAFYSCFYPHGYTWCSQKLLKGTRITIFISRMETSLVAQMVKHLPTMQETPVQSLGRRDLLEKEMATHSSILAWKIRWAKQPSGLQSMGLPKSWAWLSTLSLLFNMLSRLVITFLPMSKHLLISWLQSPSAVILELPKIKSATVSPSICHEVMGLDTMTILQLKFIIKNRNLSCVLGSIISMLVQFFGHDNDILDM